MSADRRALYWLAGLALFLGALYVLNDVLLPFVVGLALAYLLDPVADRLETWRVPRGVAAALITVVAILIMVAAILLLIPLVQAQLVDLINELPRYMDTLREKFAAVLTELQTELSQEQMAKLREKAGAVAGTDGVAWLGKVLGSLWGGGMVLLNLLSLAVITPLVAFYLLRDWDHMIAKVDSWLPRNNRQTIREQARRIDEALSGFVRGQFSVCLALGIFYAVGLTLVGVKFGLVIGLVAGLISFIPYFGAAVGLVLSTGVALAQYGFSVQPLLAAIVFFVGQTLEGYVLTPRWVGGKTGLHPVWLIFALLAGGALAGFTGLLVAVPVAATIRVLAQFAIGRYKESALYADRGAGDGAGPA
ncbi:MAG: AI-2E family transporter [Alphaproteobacteria bacterium]|nr:AI-2E family transporter [Alphaproteobacteria bacterium]